MAQNLILVAIVLFLCLMAEKLSGKVGMPALILFMGVGMLFGSDGILRIAFDDYGLAQNICLIALCFIMFYGGFNMKWSAARPVAVKAICLSTIGVVVTAGLTAVFCLVVLKFDFVDADGGCVIINGCSQRLLSIANEKTEFKGWYGVYS